jgi:hypothetical protein
MSVVWAATYQVPVTSTSQAVIEQTLSALRAVPRVDAGSACQIPGYLGPIVGGKVVTFESQGTETSFLVASSPCDQVTSGTGTAAHVDSAFDAALAQVPLRGIR